MKSLPQAESGMGPDWQSVGRIWLSARTLMRGNRILILLLLLWPCVLSVILILASHGKPEPEDVRAIVQQEWFYGLVLVAFGSSVALGNEIRARRVDQILGRPVGRSEYLLALGLSAFLPFSGYLLLLLANIWLLSARFHVVTHAEGKHFAAELAAGAMVCSAGLLASVLLPGLLAAAATALLLGAAVAAEMYHPGGWFAAFGTAPAVPWRSIATPLCAALLLFWLAAALFARKDIPRQG